MESLRTRTLDRIARISNAAAVASRILMALGILAFLASGLLLLCATVGYGFFVSIDGYDPADPAYSQGTLATEYSSFLAVSVCIVLIGFVMARMFKGIAVARTPFVRERARELKALAWLALALGILPSFVATAVSSSFGALYVPQESGVDLDAVFGALALFAFAYIFDYGCILQEQDDELL